MMESAKEAFAWIINVLKKHDIKFQISGGLAAKAYGCSRPLHDIDIEMPDESFNVIIDDVKEFIVFGPKRNITNSFDVQMLRLNYKGQQIDLTGTDEKMFDKDEGEWIEIT